MPCQPFELFCSLGRWPHVGPVAGISDVSAANGRIVADVSPARGGHQAAGGGLEPVAHLGEHGPLCHRSEPAEELVPTRDTLSADNAGSFDLAGVRGGPSAEICRASFDIQP